jgi:hypothetical protein
MSKNKLAGIIIACTIAIIVTIVLFNVRPWERTPSATHNLTIVSTVGGSVITPGQGTFTYDTGTVVNLTASPANGYQFVNWTSDVDTIADVNAASSTITMNDNYSITANFEVILPGQYSLTISSTAGGSVTTPGEGTFTGDAGTVISLAASPDTSYQFDKWTGDVGTIANINNASSTITMSSDIIITATFKATTQTYTLTTNSTPSGAGSVSPSGGKYGRGVQVILTANPASGYAFDYWSGSVSDSTPTITITMDSDKSLTANFKVATQTHTLTTNISPSGAGSVSPPSGQYEPGVQLTLRASPAIDYTFDHWSGDASGTEPTITVTMDSNRNIVSNFVRKLTPNPVPINVRIDYIAIKDAMGKIEYGEDPLIGDIQFIIVVSDGKSKPQEWYIPQEGPKGLEGYSIPDYSEIQIDKLIYHVDSAGDYLKFSILAYALHSKDNLVTAAKVLEVLAAAVGVPGADILEALILLLPVENDRVGGCEEVWYADKDYGIGEYELSCLDKSAHANLFVGLSIWSDQEPSLQPVPSTFPGVAENQTLTYHMSPNIMSGSYVQYRRVLRAGERVTGSLQLTGYYPPYSDYDYTCCFWVYDPDGNEVYKWCEDFKKDGLYHDFSFTANRDGVYRIKVGHGSLYARDLDMVISPYGWQ